MVNLEDIEISVKKAEKGSDIYGVIEKAAYKVHLAWPERRAELNWYDAQRQFIEWAKTRDYDLTGKSVEEDLKEALRFSAYDKKGFRGTSFDDWMKAQDELADKIYLWVLEHEWHCTLIE